ncbi:TPA: hypothetical protein ACNUX9_003493 [Providencia rettgeri]
MKRYSVAMALSLLVVPFSISASDVMSADFKSMNDCLLGIQAASGKSLEIVTDKPNSVSGFLSNGKGFGCDRKESGTKGVYYNGWFFV